MAENSYRQIIRSTGITGASQVIQIILKIIGNKFIAVIIGPAGIGFINLIQSTVIIISNIFGAGLSTSAVRDIAIVVQSKNKAQVSNTVVILKRLLWITGIIGLLATFFFSRQLSIIVFQSEEHVNTFRMLSIIILLSHLAAGNMAIVQGHRRIKDAAAFSIFSSLFGLIISIPLFYFYGIEATAAVLLLTYSGSLYMSWLFFRRFKITHSQVSFKNAFIQGRRMMGFGIATSLAGLFFLLSVYVLRIIVNYKLGIFYVGIFQAGWGIAIIYLQMIFQAMSRDYYPRLSAASHSHTDINKLVNEQLHLALLFAVPVIACMLFFSPWLINILYSSEFNSAVILLQWLLFGTLLKVFAWPIAYILPAMQATKLYIITELLFAIGISLLSYFLLDRFGVEGIGIAYVCSYLLYIAVILISVSKLLNFQIDKLSLQFMVVAVIMLSVIFYLRYVYAESVWFTAITLVLTGLSVAWAVREFHHLTDFKYKILKFR